MSTEFPNVKKPPVNDGSAARKYGDIIDRPRHVSAKRRPMGNRRRAAQFAPFAALTGYEAAIAEAVRTTEEKREITEDMRWSINQLLQELCETLEEAPRVAVTYFVPDARKEGGAYLTREGTVRGVDAFASRLRLADGTDIPLDDIRYLEKM